MANKAIEGKIKSLGFCCPYAYFEATKWTKPQYIARELACSRGSVHNWRRKKPKCSGANGCFQRASQESAQPHERGHDPVSSEFHFPLCGHGDVNP